MTACQGCGCPLPARAPPAVGRPRRRCAGCSRRRRADAERRRRAWAGLDLGLSAAEWAALRLTDEVLDHVARHGVVAPDAGDPAARFLDDEEDL